MNPIIKRSVGWFFFVLWIIYLYAIAYYYFIYHLYPSKIELPFKPRTIAVPADFKYRLHFHGLEKMIRFIEIDDGGLYFIRDGKKCSF